MLSDPPNLKISQVPTIFNARSCIYGYLNGLGLARLVCDATYSLSLSHLELTLTLDHPLRMFLH